MTHDEALAAVKRAIEWQDWCETRSHREASELIRSRFRTLSDALRAIAPGGPLVVMPRELTKEMIWAAHQEIDWCRNTQNTAYPRHETQKENIGGEPIGTFCEDDIRDAYRAMIAEGEKQ